MACRAGSVGSQKRDIFMGKKMMLEVEVGAKRLQAQLCRGVVLRSTRSKPNLLELVEGQKVGSHREAFQFSRRDSF